MDKTDVTVYHIFVNTVSEEFFTFFPSPPTPTPALVAERSRSPRARGYMRKFMGGSENISTQVTFKAIDPPCPPLLRGEKRKISAIESSDTEIYSLMFP